MTGQLQRTRRHDPYPWTWELPVAIAIALLAVVILAAQLGRSAANLLAGAGWTWPKPDQLVTSLAGIARGHAAAGLTSPRGHVAGPHLLWACVAGVAVLALIVCGWVGIWGLRRWGTGRVKGMASRVEAEQLLGVRRLRRVATIVRPDLHPPRRPHTSLPDGRRGWPHIARRRRHPEGEAEPWSTSHPFERTPR